MPLIRCTSCGYRQRGGREGLQGLRHGIARSAAPDALPLLRVAHPARGTACVWCYRKMPSPWRKFRGWPTRVVVGSMTVAVIGVLAYYAYPAGCRRRRLAHSRSPRAA